MNIVWLMQVVVLPLLAMAVLLTFSRLARGPSLPDRVIAIDLLTTLLIAIIAAYSIVTGEASYLDVGLILALVAFLGTVAFAHYLERSAK